MKPDLELFYQREYGVDWKLSIADHTSDTKSFLEKIMHKFEIIGLARAERKLRSDGYSEAADLLASKRI